MPLKWKIYYFFSLYLFVWGLSLLILTLIQNISHASFFPADLIIAIMLSPVICKGFISALFIGYFSKSSFYSKNQKITFLILYGTNTILTTAAAVFCFASLPQDFTVIEHASHAVKFYDISVVIATVCGTFLIIMDFQLLKAIRDKHNQNIEFIGQDFH